MARNPNWSREEEIVVLDYYFRVFRDGDDYATLTKEASELLRKMPIAKSSRQRNLSQRKRHRVKNGELQEP